VSVAVIGGGSWGTALAIHLARAGSPVRLWALEREVVEGIRARRRSPWYLADIDVPAAVEPTTDVEDALRGATLAVIVVPSEFVATTLKTLPSIPADVPILSATKGLDPERHLRMSEVIAERFPDARVAVLSGPTFAREVARGLPTAVTLATADAALGQALIGALGTRSFRPYLAADLVGAEIGGAVKNVLAIACGIVAGRRLGDNARAALITRGLAEMVRLARAKGGRAETLMGLSGLGDLTLTCTALQSRNHSLGFALGEGQALGDILAPRRSIAEGVSSAAAIAALARRLGVDMPIVAAVDAILHHAAAIDEAVAGLLARPFRGE